MERIFKIGSNGTLLPNLSVVCVCCTRSRAKVSQEETETKERAERRKTKGKGPIRSRSFGTNSLAKVRSPVKHDTRTNLFVTYIMLSYAALVRILGQK